MFAGQDFFQWIIANQLLHEVAAQQTAADDLVMYFDRGCWTHVGRLTKTKRVVSKWGTGLLYEHDLAEVPEHYGREVRFFRNPGRDPIDIFISYAKARGIQYERPQARER